MFLFMCINLIHVFQQIFDCQADIASQQNSKTPFIHGVYISLREEREERIDKIISGIHSDGDKCYEEKAEHKI